MENKKTTELLDLIYQKEKKEEYDDEFDEMRAELRKRQPFYSMSHDVYGTPIEESLEQTDKNIKLLKRHKHDPQNGDVLVRI